MFDAGDFDVPGVERQRACGAYSPHAQRRIRFNGWWRWEKIRCNRPAGHAGNHAYSTARLARRWEWTQDDQIVR